ncbi:DUF5305 domain-containing protein [Halorientalis marina]|uniref:DUF5305 domain-containing protein n=1 Tax=Halorientalis marina TaxID=2931976 RepID=UPI001FF3A314|nr:DUF5305 domain-containing protein [Halorientalis marina]
MGKRGRRIRAVLDGQFWLVVGVLGVLVVGGGYITYDAYADPGVHVEQRPGTSAEFVGEFDHRGTVQSPNPVYPTGETLANREAYFSRLTPRLNGAFTYTYDASRSGDVRADVDLELRIRSVGEANEGGQGIEYWSVTRRVNATEAASLSPGETVRVAFSRNVTELFNETRQIDERVGGTPGTKEVRLVAVVDTEGEVNDREVARTQEYPVRFSDDDSIYRVDDPGRVVNTTSTNRTVTVQNTYGPIRRGGAPLAFVLGLVGLIGLAVARYRGGIELTDAERAYMTYERSRAEFDDWITTARLDPETFAGERIDVETLDGLVDVAIDSDRRVLQDVATDTCYCRVDDLVYRYEPPPEPPEGPLATLGEQGGLAGDGRIDEWSDDAGGESVKDGGEITGKDDGTGEKGDSEIMDQQANDDGTGDTT